MGSSFRESLVVEAPKLKLDGTTPKLKVAVASVPLAVLGSLAEDAPKPNAEDPPNADPVSFFCTGPKEKPVDARVASFSASVAGTSSFSRAPKLNSVLV